MKEQSTTLVRPIRSQIYVSSLIFISSIVTGLSIGHTAVLLPHLQSESNSFTIDENLGSWIASIYTIVGPIGAILGGIASDAWGRKRTYIIGDFCMLVGWIIITSAQNGNMILIGRIFEGVSRTVRSTSKTVLADELADPKFRGLMLCGIFTSVSLGIAAISAFGAFLQWRMTSGLATVLAFITLIMFLFIHESPTWLIRKNKTMEAEKVLKKLWGPGKEEQAIEELTDLRTRLQVEENTSSTTKQQVLKSIRLFSKPHVLKPFLIMHIFNIIQIFCGMHLFTYYSVDILSRTSKFGNKILDDYYTNILISSLRTLAIFLSCYLIFSIGRRTLAIASGICSFLSAIIVGFLLFSINVNNDNVDAIISNNIQAYIIYILIIIYTIGMSLGLYILPTIMIGETQYYKIRGIVCGYIYATNDLILGGVLKLYPWLLAISDIHGLFFIFGVSCAICTVYVYLFVPETQGLTLQQIGDYFRQSNILWITRKKPFSKINNRHVKEKSIENTHTLL